jgi:NOL1/NOP2/fmu family ribosome biogenesis protein
MKRSLLILIATVAVMSAQTDEEINKIPAKDIIKTQQHEIELLRDAINITKNQGVTLGEAVQKNTELQTKIDALAKHDMDCSINITKKDAAIWMRNCIIMALGVAIGAYLFLKFYVHLPI